MKICFINFQGKHLDVLRFLTLIISIRDMSIYINIYLTWILSKVLVLSKISHSCCMQSSTDEGIEHATYMVSAFSACSIASKVCHKLRSCLMYCCLCWCLWNLPLVLQLYFFVLAPSRFMMEFTHLTWSRMKHNGCTFWKKKWVFASSNYQYGTGGGISGVLGPFREREMFGQESVPSVDQHLVQGSCCRQEFGSYHTYN